MSNLTKYMMLDCLHQFPALQFADTITNPPTSLFPAGQSITVPFGFRGEANTSHANQNDVDLKLYSITWFVPKLPLGSFTPAQHGFVTDVNGQKWYIDDVQLMVLDSIYTIRTTLQAVAPIQ